MSVNKINIVWIDMTIATRHSEVDAIFHDFFNIRYCDVSDRAVSELKLEPGDALAFEFDYPDRPGLSVLRSTKKQHPQIPILMITTQHSEQLAVWAYRNRVIDYLTTPVTHADLVRCSELLLAIRNADKGQSERAIIDLKSRIPAQVPAGQRARHMRLANALLFVQTNFRHKIRIAEVAELCDMSSFHFSHEFTESFALTFQEFLLRFRIRESCRELLHPNIPVANVAYSVGFNDPSYFARVFRRYIGLSPSEYCEQIGNYESKQRLQEIVERLELPAFKSIQEFGRATDLQQVERRSRRTHDAANYWRGRS